jgi:hypothetical protein
MIHVVEDGTIIDTKGWKGWEWTHGVALAALAHVRYGVFTDTCSPYLPTYSSFGTGLMI